MSGSTYTTNAITADCSVEASFSAIPTYTVIPSAGSYGSISPSSSQTVVEGATTSFTLSADSGYEIDSVGGTCGGSLSGSTYTTNAITADCSVQASFSAIPTYTVIPSAGSNGSISPSGSQTVVEGATTAFTVEADDGYQIEEVFGTCGGFLSDSTYTTNAITADCTVSASFSEAPTYTVTPSVLHGLGGAINPSETQAVLAGDTVEFSILPDSEYETSANEIIGTCGGTFNALTSTYITDPVTSNCSVEVRFRASREAAFNNLADTLSSVLAGNHSTADQSASSERPDYSANSVDRKKRPAEVIPTLPILALLILSGLIMLLGLRRLAADS